MFQDIILVSIYLSFGQSFYGKVSKCCVYLSQFPEEIPTRTRSGDNHTNITLARTLGVRSKVSPLPPAAEINKQTFCNENGSSLPVKLSQILTCTTSHAKDVWCFRCTAKYFVVLCEAVRKKSPPRVFSDQMPKKRRSKWQRLTLTLLICVNFRANT